MKFLSYSFFALLLFVHIACETYIPTEISINDEQVLEDVRFLSSDELEGRKTGTEGNAIARDYIEQRFYELELQKFGNSYRHPFQHVNQRTGEEFEDAVNIIGIVEGHTNPYQFIVVTAHYDHLGVEDGQIYNGADDNASGTAGLMAAAEWFVEHQPENSIIFIAFDAEEQGLGGARHFVEQPVVTLGQIILNINMDMISNNFEDEIYAVGTYHYPFLKPLVEEATINSSINVLFGYDSDEWEQDWTLASDHGPFHQKGIPFIYFGVEDHPHYHQPTDTFENINPEFYVEAVKTIMEFMRFADMNLDAIIEASGRN